MKTRFTKTLCFLICLTVLFGCFGQSASAGSYAMNAQQWAGYWDEYVREGKAVYLAPGSDDTQMRFAWLSGSNTVQPTVRISKNADMRDFVIFKGGYTSSKNVEFSAHVTATGLEAGTLYYYQCCTGNNTTEIKSFKTVAKGSAFSAVYVTDIHISGDSLANERLIQTSQNLNNVLDAALEKDDNISLIVSGGDQADSGLLPEYIGLFASPVLKTIPFALTIGNHDANTTNYKHITNNPNIYQNAKSRSLLGGDYWFVKGDALFLMLDSTNTSASDHYAFVEQAVAANPGVKWRVAVFHHDLYGGHNPNREGETRLLRILLAPIFDKFAVDLVMMGHSHVFSRSHVLYNNKVSENLTGLSSVKDPKGTVYFVSGSANKPRLPDDEASERIAFDHISIEDVIYNIINFDDERIAIKSYIMGNDSEPFDTFIIEKTGGAGGHPEKPVPFWYGFIARLGTVYNMINNIVRSIEIAAGK